VPAPVNHLLLLAQVAKEQGIGLIPKSMTKTRQSGTTFRPLREKEFWIGYGVAYKDGAPMPERDALLNVLRRLIEKHLPAKEVRLVPTVAPYLEPSVNTAAMRETGAPARARAPAASRNHGQAAARRPARPA